jgi:hypothetical protein
MKRAEPNSLKVKPIKMEGSHLKSLRLYPLNLCHMRVWDTEPNISLPRMRLERLWGLRVRSQRSGVGSQKKKSRRLEDEKASDPEAIVEGVVDRKLKPIEKILANPPEDIGCGRQTRTRLFHCITGVLRNDKEKKYKRRS